MAQAILSGLGGVLTQQGEFEEARSALTESRAINRELKIVGWDIMPLSNLGLIEVLTGNYEQAQTLLEEALRLARETDVPGLGGVAHSFLGMLYNARGDYAEARSHHEVALEGSRAWGYAFGSSMNLMGMGRADLGEGDLSSARTHLDEAEALARGAEIPVAIARVVYEQSRLSRNEGDLDFAEHLVHEAMSAAIDAGARPDAVDILEAAAGLVGAQGRHEEAARLFGAADVARESIGLVRFASEREAYKAYLEVVRDGLGDEAFAVAWQEGRAMSLEEAVAYAQRGRTGRKRPSIGWASLTPTELEVTKLVAEGLKNAEIAERMFISRNTVETHLKHVYSKLGISSRTELALEAQRRESSTGD
jgi:DNA-binding CsgD family transcriptional regulator/Flp pilus assembly protein TadD